MIAKQLKIKYLIADVIVCEAYPSPSGGGKASFHEVTAALSDGVRGNRPPLLKFPELPERALGYDCGGVCLKGSFVYRAFSTSMTITILLEIAHWEWGADVLLRVCVSGFELRVWTKFDHATTNLHFFIRVMKVNYR